MRTSRGESTPLRASLRVQTTLEERIMKENEDLYAVARQCAKIRKLQRDPEAALEISQKIIDSIKQRESRAGFDRILCTHGGALRQLGRSPKALHFAELAMKENPAHKHPYNLAGAACFDMGQFDRGNEYFDIARTKGSTDEEMSRIKAGGRKRNNEGVRKNHVYEYEEYGAFELEMMAYGKEEERRLINEELDDYSNSMEVSNEDGWFYED